jgi:predicted nucleic acid-binding protein
MILADTSVWVDHLRNGDSKLAELLEQSQVLMHPFVLGELALGSLRQREVVLSSMQDLPQVTVAIDSEVLGFIERRALFSLGIGYIDAHLLASVQLTQGASLWTRDKRLLAAAERFALATGIAR